MAIINPWTVIAAGKGIWTGTKWAQAAIKAKRTASALKKVQKPSTLSKDVTKHADTQKVRAQIADPKKKFPTAEKIKESGIKLKDVGTGHSRKGISQVKYKKPKKKLTDIERADKDAFAASDKLMLAIGVGTGAAAYSDYKKSKKRKDTRRKSKPYSQKTPVRGIQLGTPGTQSGTSRSKKGY